MSAASTERAQQAPGPDPVAAVRDEPGGPVIADAVVVAAGAARRMGGVDKLAMEVGGRPILAWTLAAIAGSSSVRRIAVVTAPERVAGLAAAPWLPPSVVAVVAGGGRRQDSVASGVAALGDLGRGVVVLIHDGARPLVSAALVDRVAAAAARHGAAIPVVPVVETLKRLAGDLVDATVDRTALVAAQTPQGLRGDVLARAWAEMPPTGLATWTDEAALLEACRIPVYAIPGEPTNLKVTVPDDVLRVEAALAARGLLAAADRTPSAGPEPLAATSAWGGLRIGVGEDGHSFGPGRPLALGGVTIEGAPRLQGHSDGDVVLHAVCDALLGAAGLGDLGRLFPAGPLTPAGIAGSDLVASCVARVRSAGLVPVSLDLTIVGARPRLASRLEPMAKTIAAMLGLPVGWVNVKASTGNLLGAEGAGRAISARAVVLLGLAQEPPR